MLKSKALYSLTRGYSRRVLYVPTKNGQELLYKDISYKIRGACFEVWKEFGNAFKESVVRNALVKKLRDLGLKVEVDKIINIYFEGKKIGTYKPDLIVNGVILIELKRRPYLTRQDDQQFWYYLKCTSYKLGFLINFGDRELEIKRRIFDKARKILPRHSALSSASIRLDNKGFTILELIVIAGIMTLLLIMVMTNFRGFQHTSTLETEAEKVASIIRQAQIHSLTGQTYGGERYNYGIHLSECSSGSCIYILFGDHKTTGDNRYDSGEEDNGGQSYNILKGVFIDNNSLTIGGSPANELDIVFEAPLGDIYFNGIQPDGVQIILSHTSAGTKTITINRVSGQVNVE